MTSTILKLYMSNPDIDRENLFYHLSLYLVNKEDIIKALHFVVDGNILDFDIDKVVDRMSKCDEFSDDEIVGWVREI